MIGGIVNNVFRLQDLTNPLPDSIIISENTRRVAKTPLDMREVQTDIAGMKTYEFFGGKKM